MANSNKGLHTYTVQESQNFQLGQSPSVFIDNDDQDVTPIDGMVFVAIQIVQDAVFNDLIAEFPDYCFGSTGTDATYAGNGTGDLVTTDVQFPSGMVIYGRWNKIDIDQGVVIAYQGS